MPWLHDYRVEQWRNGNFYGEGYLTVGGAVQQPDARGKAIILIDSSLENELRPSIAQFAADLSTDGWQPILAYAGRELGPVQVKDIVKSIYQRSPSDTKMLVLVGHIAVPYSGQTPFDGHTSGNGDHQGAWAADQFYADLDGNWTDSATVRNFVRPANDNLPNDGKYDNDFMPSAIELAVGRIDMFDMPGFAPKSEVDLLKQYFMKNHAYRMGQWNVPNRALHKNFIGSMGGFGKMGLTALDSLFENIETGPSWFNDESWAMGYYCAFSGFTASYGVAYSTAETEVLVTNNSVLSANYETRPQKMVFNIMFGSFFGDWNVTDNLLRAPLASEGWGLTAMWGNSANRYLPGMGQGESIGEAILNVANSATSFGQAGSNNYTGASHMAHSDLMGDPTLRLRVVKPLLQASVHEQVSHGFIVLRWTADSVKPSTVRIFGSNSATGPWTNLKEVSGTTSRVTLKEEEQIFDFYMLKLVELETNQSGSYRNTSQGLVVPFVRGN